MDTQEHIEIQTAIANGQAEIDQGPFYHDSWWEAYKGSIKGKLGGAVVGALVGAAVGVAAALILPLFTISASLTALAGTFAAAGMMYGAHEFSDVGRVTGAVAAAQEKAEQRQQAFEEGKFAEIKNEIGTIKKLLAAKNPSAAAPSAAIGVTSENGNPIASHCDEHCPPKKQKLIFWRVAAIGLAVGLAVGALLAVSGGAAQILAALAIPAATKAGVLGASMTTMGLFGASFGINRDLFRQVFDKTDLWFKGLLHNRPSAERQMAAQRELAEYGVKPEAPVTKIVYSGQIEYPASATYHQDVIRQAREALLSLDHTNLTPH